MLTNESPGFAHPSQLNHTHLSNSKLRTAEDIGALDRAKPAADADSAGRTVLVTLLEVGAVGLVCRRPRLGVVNLDRAMKVFVGRLQPPFDLIEASAQAHPLPRTPSESKSA